MNVDQVMLERLCEVRKQNIPVSGTLVKKAGKVASTFRIKDFTTLKNWLEKFRKRQRISLKEKKEKKTAWIQQCETSSRK